jgi:hypothetical protein
MHTTKVPPLPKGLPAPPITPTTYTGYVTPKQWHQIAPALADAEDVLMVEGFPSSTPALEGVAVYATRVTTQQLQPAHRAEHPPRSSRGPAPPLAFSPADQASGWRMSSATHPSAWEKRRRRRPAGRDQGRQAGERSRE